MFLATYPLIFYIFVFLFGIIFGSFLNVVIFRLNTGKNLGGRSRCMHCNSQLRWFELVPLASFFFGGGRCLRCKSKLSLQYPFVELISGILFVLLAYKHIFFTGTESSIAFLPLVVEWLIWGVLLVVLVYDLKHMIIPNPLVLMFIGLSLIRISLASYTDLSFERELLSGIFGAVALAGFIFLLWFISKGRWIGLGDAKLVVGIGLYLGLAQGVSALAFAFWVGATVALLLMSVKKVVQITRLREWGKSLTMKSEIPFAPFLITGMFIAEWFQSDIFHLTSLI
jgi:leader peptidase (prepilin peptidase)/N-methyltransferase